MNQVKTRNLSASILKRYFAFGAVEGLICVLWLVFLPADQKTAWLFGFSRSRIFLLGIALVGVLVFGYLMNKAKDQNWVQRLSAGVDRLFQSERLAVGSLTFLFVVFLLGVIFLYSSFTQTDFVVRPHLLSTSELIRTLMARLAPFVAWITALSLQTMVLLSLLGYGTSARYYRVVRVIAIAIFPILIAVILVIIQIDDKYYTYLTNEDNLVEWLTFAFLILAGLLSLWQAFQSWKAGSRYFWFYLLFGLGSIVLGFEEISWGQRVFQIESSEFFLENSDQQEINVHNVVNLWFGVRTKHVAAFVLFIFGVIAPLLALNPKMRALFAKLRLVTPPLFLSFGFALGAFLTLDIFSGKEEEIAELFLSLSLFLFVVLENLKPESMLGNTPRTESQPIQVGPE